MNRGGVFILCSLGVLLYMKVETWMSSRPHISPISLITAAPPNKMKVIEVCLVAPPPNSPESAAKSTFPLTFWDVWWLRFPPTQRVLFYETSTALFSESILPRLKHSLSLTLQRFLPLAGTLTWPTDSDAPFILIDGASAAVSLTVAESPADLHRLCADTLRDSAEFRDLVPDLIATSERSAVLALQVTNFPDRGFSIGITLRHAALDGRSAAMFLKSWAHFCRVRDGSAVALPSELTPSYDRTTVEDPNGIKGYFCRRWLDEGGPYNRSLGLHALTSPARRLRGTFHLARADIGALGLQVPCPTSAFVLACAYVWVCLVRAEGLDVNKRAHFAFVADCRARVEPPLPLTYFGNCLGLLRAAAAVEDLLRDGGVAVAAAAIGEPIRRLKESGPPMDAEDWFGIWKNVREERVVSVAGSPLFEVYATDFGWGRVRKTEIVSTETTGAIAISESRDGGGGLEIGLALSEKVMEAFGSIFARGLEAMREGGA